MEDMFWKKKGAWERLAKKNPKEIREKAGMILQDALDWIHVKNERRSRDRARRTFRREPRRRP